MSKINFRKLLPIFIAISCVVIVAGIVLFAVLGFNNASDEPVRQILDVRYNQGINSAADGNNDETLQTFVEDTLTAEHISYEKAVVPEFADSGSLLTPDSYLVARYTLHGADEETLASVKDKIDAHIRENSAEETGIYAFADASVSYYTANLLGFEPDPAAWRGAIALAVGAIVALAYITFRFGVGCGVAGLVTGVHDAFFTLALFAICRIPVFGFAPLLYAAVALFTSAVLWIFYGHALRTNYKEPEFASLPAEEVADRTRSTTWKQTLLLAGLIAAVVLILGLVGAPGTMNLVLPALIGVAVPVYSTLGIGPAVFAAIRAKLDKRRAAKNRVYVGKKKKAESEN